MCLMVPDGELASFSSRSITELFSFQKTSLKIYYLLKIHHSFISQNTLSNKIVTIYFHTSHPTKQLRTTKSTRDLFSPLALANRRFKCEAHASVTFTRLQFLGPVQIKKTLFILTFHYATTFHYSFSLQNMLPKTSYNVFFSTLNTALNPPSFFTSSQLPFDISPSISSNIFVQSRGLSATHHLSWAAPTATRVTVQEKGRESKAK